MAVKHKFRAYLNIVFLCPKIFNQNGKPNLPLTGTLIRFAKCKSNSENQL